VGGEDPARDRGGAPSPGSLIALTGTLNLRDLGGWPTRSGDHVAWGMLYRSDRLSDLTPGDHDVLDEFGITTVIDLRYEAEADQHPSNLWSSVDRHLHVPMGGDLADQRTFIERALAGEFDGITDHDVGESYIDFLTGHANDFGTAVEALSSGGPSLFHCTAGKDRTGLLSMLLLRTVGVADVDVLRDFTLSNEYRADRRIAQLRPVFVDHGLEIERFRPALSAPAPALVRAMAWLDEQHGSTAAYLAGPCGVAEPVERLQARLLDTGTH
jgi:protein-tyrosine phosphatase